MDVLCLGDSHTLVFKMCNNKQKRWKFNIVEVPGATAQGAVNPHSKSDALRIFGQNLNSMNASKLLVMLGEVDCGFVIWVRSKRENISVDEQINNSINNLFKFLETRAKKFNNENIIIAGVPLPTIRDTTDKNLFVNNTRGEVEANQLERTNKTLEFNNILKERCSKCNYKYIEITSSIIGNDGLVSSHFLNRDPKDHHLDSNKTWGLWIKELDRVYNL